MAIELALDDCQRAAAGAAVTNDNRDSAVGSRGGWRLLLCLLEAAVHSNIGTINYRLGRVMELLVSYKAAKAALEGDGGNMGGGASLPPCKGGSQDSFDGGASYANAPHDNGNEDNNSRRYATSHTDKNDNKDPGDKDDNDGPLLPRNNLLLVVRVGLLQVLLRSNKPNEALKYQT